MNYLIGLLIVVLGLTLVISGVTGTAGQVYAAVTGRGDAGAGAGIAGPIAAGQLTPDQLNQIFGYPHTGGAAGAGG